MTSIKKIFTLLFILVVLIVAIAISSMNSEHVLLNLHWYQLNWPLGFTLLLFLCLGVLFGIALGWLFWTWPAMRERTQWKRSYFQLKQNSEEEVAKLQHQVVKETEKDQGSGL